MFSDIVRHRVKSIFKSKPMKAVTLTRLLYWRFFRKDADAGFALLHKLGAILLPGYRFSYNHLDWWRNEGFNRYLIQFGE